MTKPNTLSTCLPHSAWRSWQDAGIEWRGGNPDGDAEAAASEFSSLPGWPDIGKSARYRAFLEGAGAS